MPPSTSELRVCTACSSKQSESPVASADERISTEVSRCCAAAVRVIIVDADGKVVRSWVPGITL